MRSVLSSSLSLISGFFAPTTRTQRQTEIAEAFREHAPFIFRVLRRLGVEAHALDDLVAALPGPDEVVDARQASEFIQSFCDQLSAPLRDVFVCVELEGMSGPEAGEALGVRLNTVYTRLRRARAAFNEAVEARGDGDG
jgi:DNA-directed RNA polymerase specialized sigma24 family protein